MGLYNLQGTGMQDLAYRQQIHLELIKQLYKVLGVGLWAESATAIAFTFAMWGAIQPYYLILWLLFNLIFAGLYRHLLIFYFNRQSEAQFKKNHARWFWLFTTGVIFSGISWGLVGSVLMVKNDILRQTFSVFMMLGVTAAANPLYSSIRSIYNLFLVLAFVPLTVWFFLQGGIFLVIGFLSIVYIMIMLGTSYRTYQLLNRSLYMRFEITDLIENLSLAKSALEKRTTDLEKSLSLVRATLESTTNGILVINAKSEIEDFNHKFLTMWQVPRNLLQKHETLSLFKHLEGQLNESTSFINKLQTISEVEEFDELHFKDGRVFECYSIPQMVGNKCVGRVWSFHDFTERKMLEAQLFHKINYDSLTELPNRSLALDRLAQALSHAKQSNLSVALLFLDLDRMKLINDTLGHSFGDKLLVEVAGRLKSCIGSNDTVSRVGGDEFVIILTALKTENDTIGYAKKILNAIREPFMVEGNRFNISTSIGISFYPKDGNSPELLIKNADIAMYRAKELGRNNFQFFTEEMNKKVLTRLVIENQLRNALELNEFSLVYQPVVNLKSGYIVGLEALLRWKHPKLGMISPSDFIQIAEESGMIVPIGDWVLRNACAQTKEWHRKGFTHLQIAVNLSLRQFRQANILEHINDILTGIELDPHYLALELTESIVMDDVEKKHRHVT